MGRQPRAGGPYVPPIDVAASQSAAADTFSGNEAPRGKFTLTLGTTYVYVLGGEDAPFLSAHVRWDSSIVITSITVEDCNCEPVDVANYSTTAGDWINENPSTAFVGVVGAGASATNGVVAVTGGAAGGAMFHVAETAGMRSRLKVVVGATGGVLSVASHGKM